MRALLSTYGSRGDLEPMVGLEGQSARRCGCARRPRWRTRPRARPSWSPPEFDTVAAGGRGMGCAGRDRREADRRVAMTENAVVIAGGGPTGLLLAGELA